MPLQEETRLPPQFLPLSIARAVWKRKLWVLLVWVGVSAATFFVVMQMPPVYRAQSLILIEGQRIPERYVPATIDDELSNRLSMLTQQTKSYTALLDIIEQFDLYKEERKTMVEEEIIAKMRNDIEVKAVQGWSRQSFPAFTISYEGSNPALVAQVTGELTRKFHNQNLKMRGDQARGTQQFLGSQVEQARLDLEKQEKLLSDFRQRYHGELPNQTSALLGKLSRLELQLRGVQDSMRSAEQQKTLLANSLASAQNSLTTFRELTSQTPASSSGPVGAPARLSQPPSELQKAEALLANLRMRYSEDHPDVMRMKAQIEMLKKVEALAQPQQTVATGSEAGGEEQPQLAAASTPPTPTLSLATMLQEHEDRVRNIQVQLQILAEEQASLEKDKARILADMNDTQRRVEALPLVEQELAKVIRDYDISRQNYHKLLDQKKEADLAADMETLEKAERLVVLDMPRVPSKPIKPRREMLNSMGCIGGLAFGVLLAFAIELRRGALLGEWELPEGSTVLGRVPPIKLAVAKRQERFTPKEVKRSRWPKARVTLRLRSPRKRLVVAPTILLFLLSALVATSIYAGWSPF
jgi:polysaccharide chain length determinant protein (PEP-CTERM system associated)